MIPFAAGLLPVLLFLGGLMLMDSYQLVARRVVLRALAAGAITALVAFGANILALRVLHVPPALLTSFVAPIIEESLKMLWVVAIIRRDRAGFLVDSGILGFAIGAGFALIENVYYMRALADPDPLLWIVRGFGTAVMHGCATAIAAVVSKDLTDRHRSKALVWFFPGLAIAVAAHAVFNLLTFQPLITIAIMLATMPLLLLLVFTHSERATREWLGMGLDTESELLELLRAGEISQTRVGHYLDSLKHRFPGPVVADMLCLLQVQLELSLRAKGMMIARSAGIELPIDRDVRANLKEMRFLEDSIGPTGRLAIMPFLRTHSRDLWQIHMMMRR